MLAIIIEFEVKPDCVARFEERLRADTAETLRDEGCHRMEVLQVEGAPNRFVLNELWRDETAIEAHRLKPGHNHEWQEPLITAKRVIRARLQG